MQPLILMGDEAIAQAALDAGISGAFAYPGTPSTEIFQYFQHNNPVDRPLPLHWSTNEKTAYEQALGMSFAGKRATVSMKHVGLNVAADPFMNSAVTGANGGLLVIVADDPGMHSSQNEQDTRQFAEFASVPLLEPSTQQEAYDMAYAALAFSEEVQLPVVMRVVTRLAHSRAPVIPKAPATATPQGTVEDPSRFTLLPVNARQNWARLIARWPQVEQALWKLPFNQLQLKGTALGVVVAGVGFNYFMENVVDGVGESFSMLKVGTYPPPRDMLEQLFEHCDEILVVEDGYPFLESRLKGMLDTAPKPVHGRLDGWLPRTGEINPTLVRRALHMQARPTAIEPLGDLASRPPALCTGCPHADTYKILNQIIAEDGSGNVLGDIGCYTLGALPPFTAIDSCVDMGASVGMALGAALAGVHPAFGVIGDSTFAHSGMTGLLDAVRINANMVLVIVDNGTVAMTGMQDTSLTGETLDQAILGLGVPPEHLRVITPLPNKHSQNLKIVREEVDHPGISVVIARRHCIHI